jgi:hypothetical protein
MEECEARMVARLRPLPESVLKAWTALLGGANATPAGAAAIVLLRLVRTGADETRRVISTPVFPQVGLRLMDLSSLPGPWRGLVF